MLIHVFLLRQLYFCCRARCTNRAPPRSARTWPRLACSALPPSRNPGSPSATASWAKLSFQSSHCRSHNNVNKPRRRKYGILVTGIFLLIVVWREYQKANGQVCCGERTIRRLSNIQARLPVSLLQLPFSTPLLIRWLGALAFGRSMAVLQSARLYLHVLFWPAYSWQ